MKWTIISDDLQVRLEEGKPKFSARQGLILEEAIEAVKFWLGTHQNAEAEAWLEEAADEFDLRKREADIAAANRALDELVGSELEHEPPRVFAIRQRKEEQRTRNEFIEGEEALRLGDYVKAAVHLGLAANAFHPDACFLMGQLYEKGMGVPQDYVEAYMMFNEAAEWNSQYPADEARERIWKLMSIEERRKLTRIVNGH